MARSGSARAPDLDPETEVLGVDRLEPTGSGLSAGPVPTEIPGSLPGEVVRVEIEHAGRHRRYARLLDVLEPSEHRIRPGCPHFLACGGCQLLHAEGRFQRRHKRAGVAEALGLELDRVDPVVPSPRDFGYRAFAKLVVGEGGLILGSYRPRSHDVESMRGCRIHAAPIEQVADALRDDFRLVPAPPELRYVLLRASMSEGAVLVTLVTASGRVPGLDRVIGLLRELDRVRAVVQHVNPSEGDALWGRGPTREVFRRGPLLERVGPVEQDLLAGAFSQVNPEGAALLYQHVSDRLLEGGPIRRAADLFAGSGGIAQTLLHAGVDSVVAVEATPAAAAALEEAGSRWPGRLEVRSGAVEAHRSVLDDLEAAVVNPPRKGLGPVVIEALLERGPPRLGYVSCDPTTLARDLKALAAAYRIERVTPFDLFPQTRHVETVVIASRRDGPDRSVQ